MEFAAATVVFARANEKSRYEGDCCDEIGGDGGDGGEDGNGGNEDGNDTDNDGITNGEIETQVVALLQGSHKKLFPYYMHCVDQHHKHFLWTGPELQIVPRTPDITPTIIHTSTGEALDLPSHPIDHFDADLSPTTNNKEAPIIKCRGPGKGFDFDDKYDAHHPPVEQRRDRGNSQRCSPQNGVDLDNEYEAHLPPLGHRRV